MLPPSVMMLRLFCGLLPPLSKKYALQMLYVSAPVAAAAMEDWVFGEYAAKHRIAVDRLLQLRVFVEGRDRGSLPREPIPSNVTARLPSLEELENYTLEQWEGW